MIHADTHTKTERTDGPGCYVGTESILHSVHIYHVKITFSNIKYETINYHFPSSAMNVRPENKFDADTV